MLPLTRQERSVVIVMMCVCLLGTAGHYFFKKFPHLDNLISVLENDSLSKKIDINTASYEKLVNLPLIGPATANRILEYRNRHGAFESMDAFMTVRGVGKAHFERMKKLITIDPRTLKGK